MCAFKNLCLAFTKSKAFLAEFSLLVTSSKNSYSTTILYQVLLLVLYYTHYKGLIIPVPVDVT